MTSVAVVLGYVWLGLAALFVAVGLFAVVVDLVREARRPDAEIVPFPSEPTNVRVIGGGR